jgi:hypothetical protein
MRSLALSPFIKVTSYRPETHVRMRFQEIATFKQVELRLLFNKLKRQHTAPVHPAPADLVRPCTSSVYRVVSAQQ